MKKWQDVVKHPNYLKADTELRKKWRDEFFTERVEKWARDNGEDVKEAKVDFYKTSEDIDPTLKDTPETYGRGGLTLGGSLDILKQGKESAKKTKEIKGEFEYQQEQLGKTLASQPIEKTMTLLAGKKAKDKKVILEAMFRQFTPEQREKFIKTTGISHKPQLATGVTKETITDPADMLIGLGLGAGLGTLMKVPITSPSSIIREAIAETTIGMSEIPIAIGKKVVKEIGKTAIKEVAEAIPKAGLMQIIKNPDFGVSNQRMYSLLETIKRSSPDLLKSKFKMTPEVSEHFVKTHGQVAGKKITKVMDDFLDGTIDLNTAIRRHNRWEIPTKIERIKEPGRIIHEPRTIETQRVIQDIPPAPTVAKYETLSTPKIIAEGDGVKYAGSVNLKRQAIEDAAKELEIDIFKKYGQKRVVTNKKTINEAENILKRFESDPAYLESRLNAIRRGETPTTAEELAHRLINANEVTDLALSAKRLASGEMTEEVFNAKHQSLKDRFLNITNPLASESGRRFQMYNIEVGKNRAFSAIGKLKGRLNKRQAKELAEVDWDSPRSVLSFTERLSNPKLMDYVYEFWYNSILSGIPTHLVNVTSNTLWSAFQLPHRALTGIIDKTISCLRGGKREFFMNEIVPMMAGMKRGFRKGAAGAWEVIRTGKTVGYETKWSREIGTNIIGAFSRSNNKFIRKYLSPAISSPSRALRSMDVWANSIAYDSQLGALAKRLSTQAKKKGVKDWHKLERELLQNPTQEMMEQAGKYAQYSTFMDEPGKFTQKMIEMRGIGIETPIGKIEPLRFVVPFVNTIANLAKRGVEMTPLIGLSLARNRKAADIIAKQIEGAIITFFVLNKCNSGELTGSAPSNKAEREAFYRQGKLPYAVKLGDEWLQYRRIEPFNTPIATISNAYDVIKNAEDDQTATELMGKVGRGVVGNLIDSSYMQGIQMLLDRHGRLKGAMQRTLSSFIPFSGFWRSINRLVESATEGKVTLKETQNLLGAFSQVIPGLSNLAEPRLNVWGEEIELKGNVFRQWLPYKWRAEKPDRLEKTFEKLGFYPSLPTRHIKIKGEEQEIPSTLWQNFVIQSGREAKEKMERAISQPSFSNMSETAQLKVLDNIYTKAKNRYRNKLRQGITYGQ